MCVCVCVCERASERASERERASEGMHVAHACIAAVSLCGCTLRLLLVRAWGEPL